MVDLGQPMLHPFSDPRGGLVALANRADVAQVVVDGRVLIDDGRLGGGDEAAICADGTKSGLIPDPTRPVLPHIR